MIANPLPLSVRLYCGLLRLYPAAFRRSFMADMAADVIDGYDGARTCGRLSVVRFLFRAYSDLLTTLCQQALAADRAAIAASTIAAAGTLWGGTVLMLAMEWPDGPARSLLYLQLAAFFGVLGLAACVGVGWLSRRAPIRLNLEQTS